jgi:hypothetical protein
MGSGPRHSTRAVRPRSARSRSTQATTQLSAIAALFADATAVIETAAAAIEASETHAAAAVTLRVGIRSLVDAHTQLEQAVGT